MSHEETALKRVAIFYDGTFFWRLSQYYKFSHERKAFIGIDGFHEYVRHKVAAHETGKNVSLCQIVEAHLFRGRFTLQSAQTAHALDKDRLEDQILMFGGVITHYYPMNEKSQPPEEKGIDVWLALEAYDLAVHKRFDVMVLVAGDQDYVPLIRKVNGLGTRVMIIGADLDYKDQSGQARYQKTSQKLIDEASYTVMITEDIKSKIAKGDAIIDGLFKQ